MGARFESVGEIPRLPEDTFELLLGATREGLTNVRKHAKATSVRVTLTALPHQLALDICDNGSGFSDDADEGSRPGTTGGFGLTTLREQVAKQGGQCIIESAPGEGATLSIQLPLLNPSP
jgi:signal transduction histidine kinase